MKSRTATPQLRRSRGSLEKRLPRPVEEHDQTIASRPLCSAGVVRHLWLDHIPCRRPLSTRLGPVKWPRDDSWQRGMLRLGNTTVLEPETRERKAWVGATASTFGEEIGHSGAGCEASPTRMDARPHCQRFSMVGSYSWCPEPGQITGANGCIVGPARERGLHTTQGRG